MQAIQVNEHIYRVYPYRLFTGMNKDEAIDGYLVRDERNPMSTTKFYSREQFESMWRFTNSTIDPTAWERVIPKTFVNEVDPSAKEQDMFGERPRNNHWINTEDVLLKPPTKIRATYMGDHHIPMIITVPENAGDDYTFENVPLRALALLLKGLGALRSIEMGYQWKFELVE